MSIVKNFLLQSMFLGFCCFLTSCYTIKNDHDQIRINLQFFKNETNIYGLENDLSSYLSSTLRHETNFRTGNNSWGYIVKGKILDYKKKVVRKNTIGDPTHQQVEIVILMEFYENDKILFSQKLSNIAYRIDSGLYNITMGGNEAQGRTEALRDISEAIATRISYFFMEAKS